MSESPLILNSTSCASVSLARLTPPGKKAGPALRITVLTPDCGVAHAPPSEPAVIARAASAGTKRQRFVMFLMRFMIILLFSVSDGIGQKLSVFMPPWATRLAAAGWTPRPRGESLWRKAAVEP